MNEIRLLLPNKEQTTRSRKRGRPLSLGFTDSENKIGGSRLYLMDEKVGRPSDQSPSGFLKRIGNYVWISENYSQFLFKTWNFLPMFFVKSETFFRVFSKMSETFFLFLKKMSQNPGIFLQISESPFTIQTFRTSISPGPRTFHLLPKRRQQPPGS